MENKQLEKVNFDFEILEKCLLCENKVFIPNGKIQWQGIDFWYVFCPKCGLKFMNPRPTLDSYKKFYKDLFWQQKIRNIGFHQKGQLWQDKRYKWDDEKVWDASEGKKNRMEKHREQRSKTIISALENYIGINKESRVLEVGCGFGVTLDELFKKFHCKVFGIEPSDEGIETIKKEFKDIKLLGSFAEELETLGKKELKFDAIIFSHVLENTVDPLKVLKFANKRLKDNGIIYIQTPNLFVFDQMNPYHAFIFSPNSLRFLTEKAGLQYKQISETMNKMLTAVCLRN